MKKTTFLMVIVLMTMTSYGQVTAYNVGDTVDDFTVTDVDGVVHNLYNITATGKTVYLDFFFADCGPCQQTASIYNEFHERYGSNQLDLYMISINAGNGDTSEYVNQYEEMHGGDFDHAPITNGTDSGAGAVTSNFGIAAFPTFCVIGVDNTLVISDIWPLTGVETFEDTFDEVGINPATLGVLENTSLTFSLYPNPSNGTFRVTTPQSLRNAELTIYDLLGKKLHTQKLSTISEEIQINLGRGAYVVMITSQEGSSTQKLIVR